MRRHRRMGVLALVLAGIAGCGSEAMGGLDASDALDAGTRDAASDDASSGEDAAPLDGSLEPDGAVRADAQVLLDAATADDAGAFDASSPLADGGVADAATSADAAAGDAAASDGGTSDAAVTACTLEVSPTRGLPTDTFTFTAMSDGTACTAEVDGMSLGAVGCSGTTSVVGSIFGVGMHTVSLVVGSGPGGPTRCSVEIVVEPPVTTTSCAITVEPASGTTADTFTARFASNGTGCELRVGGLSLGAVDCNGMYSAPGSAAGPGTYTATLVVGDGPGGPTSCDTSFTITAP